MPTAADFNEANRLLDRLRSIDLFLINGELGMYGPGLFNALH
jgi:hypothetical protein